MPKIDPEEMWVARVDGDHLILARGGVELAKSWKGLLGRAMIWNAVGLAIGTFGPFHLMHENEQSDAAIGGAVVLWGCLAFVNRLFGLSRSNLIIDAKRHTYRIGLHTYPIGAGVVTSSEEFIELQAPSGQRTRIVAVSSYEEARAHAQTIQEFLS